MVSKPEDVEVSLTKNSLIQLAIKGTLTFKVDPFYSIIITNGGKESRRKLCKGERVKLKTHDATDLDAILKGLAKIESKMKYATKPITICDCSPPNSPKTQFLMVERKGEDCVEVSDVFPRTFKTSQKNLVPRSFWIEVNRLIEILPATSKAPQTATASTESNYDDDEIDEKNSYDIKRELFLVEELGHAHDRISELEEQVMQLKTQNNALLRASSGPQKASALKDLDPNNLSNKTKYLGSKRAQDALAAANKVTPLCTIPLLILRVANKITIRLLQAAAKTDER